MEDGDRRRFALATMRFVASLRNGHTAFDDAWLWETHGAPLGLEVVPSRGDWVVRRSVHAGLVPGIRILAIDGVPIEAVAAERLPFVAGSSARERARKLFARPFLFPERFEVSSDRGRTVLHRGAALPPRPPGPTIRWLEPGPVALLTLPSFAAPEHERNALRLLCDLPPTSRLIVDLRGNGGGDTPERLIARLMDRPWRSWRAETPVHDALRLAQGGAPGRRTIEAEHVAPVSRAFAGPLAILVDGGTISAAEDFALPFQDNGRAVLVGETTAGSSGQPARFDLGDGMRLWVGAKRQFLPGGGAFEGVGLLPDIAVDADHAGGADPILAAALQSLI